MSRSRRSRLHTRSRGLRIWLAAAVGSVGLSAPALAGSSDWAQDGGGSWTTAAWSSGVPNGAGDIAAFGAAQPRGGNVDVSVDAPIALGGLRISSNYSNNFALNIASPSPITFENIAGAAFIELASNNVTQTMATPIVLNSPLNIAVWAQNTQGQTLAMSGPVSGAAGNALTINGDLNGIVSLSGNSPDFRGDINVIRGTLSASSGAALGASSKQINISGKDATLQLYATSAVDVWQNIRLQNSTGIRYGGAITVYGVGPTILHGNLDLGNDGSSLLGGGAMTIGGVISGGSLTQLHGLLQVTNSANTYTGWTNIGASGVNAIFSLREQGTDGQTAGFIVNQNSALSIDNTAGNIMDGTSVTGRIHRPVVLRGGGVEILGAANGDSFEMLPSLTLDYGDSVLRSTAGGSGWTAGLQVMSLQRNPRATVAFSVSTGGSIFVNGLGNGLIGPWATIGNDWAAHDLQFGVIPLATYQTGDQSLWTAGDNVNLTSPTALSAARSINTLKIQSADLDLGSSQLNILSGGLLKSGNASTVSASGSGSLTAGGASAAELILTVNASALTISAPISDNGGMGPGGSTVSLVKSGAGRLILSGSNSYTGGTTINGGVLELDHAGARTELPPGTVTIAGGNPQIPATLGLRSDTDFSPRNNIVVRDNVEAQIAASKMVSGSGSTFTLGNLAIGSGSTLDIGGADQSRIIVGDLSLGDKSQILFGSNTQIGLIVTGNYSDSESNHLQVWTGSATGNVFNSGLIFAPAAGGQVTVKADLYQPRNSTYYNILGVRGTNDPSKPQTVLYYDGKLQGDYSNVRFRLTVQNGAKIVIGDHALIDNNQDSTNAQANYYFVSDGNADAAVEFAAGFKADQSTYIFDPVSGGIIGGSAQMLSTIRWFHADTSGTPMLTGNRFQWITNNSDSLPWGFKQNLTVSPAYAPDGAIYVGDSDGQVWRTQTSPQQYRGGFLYRVGGRAATIQTDTDLTLAGRYNAGFRTGFGTATGNGITDVIFNKTGGAALNVAGDQSWNSGCIFNALAGTTNFYTDPGLVTLFPFTAATIGGQNLTVNVGATAKPAQVNFGAPVTKIAALNIAAGSKAAVRTLDDLSDPDGAGMRYIPITAFKGRKVLVTNALTLSGATDAWTSTLDLGANDMIIQSDLDHRDSVLATITNQIKTARNTSPLLWQGTGLTTSAASPDPRSSLMGLAVILNEQVDPLGVASPVTTRFDDQDVNQNCILVKYTLNGDMNLDGKINFNDYFQINTGFLSGGKLGGYRWGDLDYDGRINFNDYYLINTSFLNQNIASPGLAMAQSAIPEPGMLAMLLGGALCLASRCRPRRR